MDFLEPLYNLMESGGNVLWVLFGVAFVIVTQITDRVVYYRYSFPKLVQETLSKWNQQSHQSNLRSFYERQYEVSKIKETLGDKVSSIEVLTFMCPLFGLLGTVTGMIAVFDVMAHKGLGNPRLMASGVSQATLPTMVSMVIALVGLIGLNYLKGQRKKLEVTLSESFKLQEDQG